MLDALGGLLVGVLVVVLFMVVGTVWFVAGFFRRRTPRDQLHTYTDPNATVGDVGWSGGHRRGGDDGSDGGWFGGSDGGSDGGGGGGGD